jgi:hypothetical protein
MQTLISVFEKWSAARRAVEHLVRSGFDAADIHLQESGEPVAAPDAGGREQDLELGARVMQSAEREVAVDAGVLDSISHVFSLLFGQGSGEAGSYSDAVRRGQSVLVVDAKGDDQAEVAAVILHEEGALDVDDHRPDEVPEGVRRDVHKIERPAQPSLRELRAESPLASLPESKSSQ